MCRSATATRPARRCPSSSPAARKARRHPETDAGPVPVDVSYRSFKLPWNGRLVDAEILPEMAPDPEVERALIDIKRDPAAMVRIYRTVPAAKNQINPGGEWVSMSWSMAEEHKISMTNYWRRKYHVLSAIVPASDLMTTDESRDGGVNLTQFGYYGPQITAATHTGGAPGAPYAGEEIRVGDWVSICALKGIERVKDGGGFFWARVTGVVPGGVIFDDHTAKYPCPLDRITHHEPRRVHN